VGWFVGDLLSGGRSCVLAGREHRGVWCVSRASCVPPLPSPLPCFPQLLRIELHHSGSRHSALLSHVHTLLSTVTKDCEAAGLVMCDGSCGAGNPLVQGHSPPAATDTKPPTAGAYVQLVGYRLGWLSRIESSPRKHTCCCPVSPCCFPPPADPAPSPATSAGPTLVGAQAPVATPGGFQTPKATSRGLQGALSPVHHVDSLDPIPAVGGVHVTDAPRASTPR
jgi:hypothetical protein